MISNLTLYSVNILKSVFAVGSLLQEHPAAHQHTLHTEHASTPRSCPVYNHNLNCWPLKNYTEADGVDFFLFNYSNLFKKKKKEKKEEMFSYRTIEMFCM